MRPALGVMGVNEFDLEEMVVALNVCSGTGWPSRWVDSLGGES